MSTCHESAADCCGDCSRGLESVWHIDFKVPGSLASSLQHLQLAFKIPQIPSNRDYTGLLLRSLIQVTTIWICSK